MLESQRHLFDLPDDVTYLRAASSTPLLKRAADVGHGGIDKKLNPWRLGHDEAFTEPDAARALFAAMIGASADDIALQPAASYGLSTAAANLDAGLGRTIVLLEQQFPSNVYPWRELVAREGGEIVTVARPEGDRWTEAVIAAIGPETAVVALANCHWTDGSMLDLAAIAARAHGVGAALVLDISQSLGVVPIDVAKIDPDFLVCVSYKWLLGPYQLCFCYAAPRRQRGRPIEHNWVARANAEDYSGLVDYVDDYAPGARRFDTGERGNYVSVPMVCESLRQIAEWGVAEIAATLRPLVDEIADRGRAIGLSPTPAAVRAPHFLGLRRPAGLPAGLDQRLMAENVYVSIRGDAIRVAPHVYNSSTDIDRLFEVLGRVLN